MSTNSNPTPPLKNKKCLIRLVLGIVVFGVLMGSREDFPHRWQRTLAAAVAGGILALSLSQYRKPDEQKRIQP
jgi:hypothetical protein